jgi:hypothetical protein
MQDKIINNTLLALYRTGEARVHVEALMALWSIPAPSAFITGHWCVGSASGWRCFYFQAPRLL